MNFFYANLLFLSACILLTAGCSNIYIPNLEPVECTQSRATVKQLYSFHIGNDMKFTPENLKLREKFLTPEFFRALQSRSDDFEPFTQTLNDPPRAFRLAECEMIGPAKTKVNVLLFWRDDTRTEQRKISVEAVRAGENWLVNNVANSISEAK
jgi:hypothetical protein